jgi:hypothetical protein
VAYGGPNNPVRLIDAYIDKLDLKKMIYKQAYQKGYKVPTGLAGGSQIGIGQQTMTSIPR